MDLRQWGADLADLVLGRACLVCEAPGPSLCTACIASLRARGGPWRAELGTLDPRGCLPLWFALPYRGVGARLVLAYKEHGHLALSEPLGLLLADAIAAALEPRARAVCLLPVPSTPRSARGFDALDEIVRAAGCELARRGMAVSVARVMQFPRGHRSVKSLDRRARWSTIQGTMRLDVSIARSLPTGMNVVVDDVVTTGATTMEMVRLLRAADVEVAGIAAVAHQAHHVNRGLPRSAAGQPGYVGADPRTRSVHVPTIDS